MSLEALQNQEHAFLNGTTRPLKELFQDFGGVDTILRFSPNIFSEVNSELNTRDISLFNTPDHINNHLLNQSEGVGLLAEIHGPGGIINGSSLKVVRILETKNLKIEEIRRRGLYSENIPHSESVEEMIDWLSRVFYKGEKHIGTELLHRKIKK